MYSFPHGYFRIFMPDNYVIRQKRSQLTEHTCLFLPLFLLFSFEKWKELCSSIRERGWRQLRCHLWGSPWPPSHSQRHSHSQHSLTCQDSCPVGCLPAGRGGLRKQASVPTPPLHRCLESACHTWPFSAKWHFMFAVWLVLDVDAGAGGCRWGHLTLQRTDGLFLKLGLRGKRRE